MNVTLREEDALALDLLLDRSRVASADGPGFALASAGGARVRSAEKVLGLLQWLPEAEPPQDLVARTLRFVDESAEGLAVRGGTAAPAFAGPHRPHA